MSYCESLRQVAPPQTTIGCVIDGNQDNREIEVMIGQKMIIRFTRVLLTAMLLALPACDGAKQPAQGRQSEKITPEILVYCGMTMTGPVMEIASLVEKEKNCKVRITYGESQWLKDTALASKTGDVYFPGSPSYLKSMLEDKTVVETVEVGKNRIVFMVKKGNPKKVASDLRELLREDLKIVLGDPDAGSIGKETKISLDKLKIFGQAADKALYLTPDSKGLSQAVRSGDADVVVNWRALAVLKDNAEYMDIVPLPEEQTERRILTMGRLSFSKHEDLARYFLNRAISEKGREIFTVYGF